jgi:serine/threonine protein phosphatase PrpC
VTDNLVSQLFTAEESLSGAVQSAASVTAVVYSLRGPDRSGDSDVNQDSAAVFEVSSDAAVLAVADGAGGMRSGAEASKVAVNAIRHALLDGLQNELVMRSSILNAFEAANHEVMAMGVGAATTLAAVELQGNQIRPYHVGDSIVLAVGQRGKIKMQPVAHSPVGYAVQSGLVDEKKAMHHEDRHIVYNLIGFPEMHIEVGPVLTLSRWDTVLIASDGVSDNLHTDEIVSLIRKGPLKKAAAALASRATTRMAEPVEGRPSKPDDMTFILFRLNG